MTFNLQNYLQEKKSYFESELKRRWVPEESEDPSSIHKAMRYSLFSDGKRVRPILTFASAEMLGLSADDVFPIAAAMEMIHVFSLIHDDLPAMDDDDFRRGQPTNHKVFGDATAILAGDALLALAFVPLTDLDHNKYDPKNILKVIRLFSEATGTKGMIGGQVIDLESERKEISKERLEKLHLMKTGALIRASILGPAYLKDVSEEMLKNLECFAKSVGLSFQIADDILDVEGGEEIGKDVGSDIEKGKSTYVSLLGLDGAKKELSRVYEEGLQALQDFGEKAIPLRELARYIVERKK